MVFYSKIMVSCGGLHFSIPTGQGSFLKIISRLSNKGNNGLKKTHAVTQMKYYKFIARPILLYGSEIWITATRDMPCLEAAEMLFLRSVKGYTRLDKIRSEVIRNELEISGI
jgi:hypothetical protein